MAVSETERSLLQRVEALEKKQRATQRVALAFAAVVLIATLTAQTSGTTPNVVGNPNGQHVQISDGGIAMYDANNRKRLFLGFEDGTPIVETFVPGGTTAAIMSGYENGGFFRIRDKDGKLRGYFGIYTDGTPGVSLYGPNEKPLYVVNTYDYGAATSVYDKNGTERGYYGMFSDGEVGFNLNDKGDKRRIAMNTTPDGQAVFHLKQPDGKDQIEVETTSNGGYFRSLDTAGTARAYLGVYTDGSFGTTIFNASHGVVWHSP